MARRREDIIIANGASLSNVMTTFAEDGVLVGFFMPSNWDAAVITLVAVKNFNDDPATQGFPVYDSAGNEVSFTVAANRFIALDPKLLVGIPFVAFRSGTSGAAVNQTAKRTITPFVV